MILKTHLFSDYYEERARNGLPAEKKNCIFTKGGYSSKDVEKLILGMPFKRFEGMGYMRHSKYLGIIQIDKSIMKDWNNSDLETVVKNYDDALERYRKLHIQYNKVMAYSRNISHLNRPKSAK